ncbi:TVG1559742 [Thermoplasma volcanium GSS1]|uniref:TVG1559742 protein n=1 Tax=Thermoplasma volcanium (strain ATCC 51530 / DSM 4299 / JCM 9571 / NBRC 15438 / GSS1) TaxID=273116 RepID=Q978B2_THEVO|nr:TVG1559742 [Thermoplasma volcanium GSS1]
MAKMDENTYQCEICKLHYKDESDAKKCQDWCSQHNSCNLEITSRSLEASKSRHTFS